GLRRLRTHLLERQRDVVVARRAPILDQLAVAIEHDDVPRREHVLAWVGKVLDGPQHVEGRGEEDRSYRGGDPCLLRPEPHEGLGPGGTLAATVRRCGSQPFALLLRALTWAASRRVRALRQE